MPKKKLVKRTRQKKFVKRTRQKKFVKRPRKKKFFAKRVVPFTSVIVLLALLTSVLIFHRSRKDHSSKGDSKTYGSSLWQSSTGPPFQMGSTELDPRVASQNPDPPSGPKGSYAFVPQRLALRAIEREGIGYPKGYATLEVLFAPYTLTRVVPMVDVRGHHLYNDTYAGNVGLIGRYLPRHHCFIVGANIYYDFREGCMAFYNQIGCGMEILGRRWDFRFNAYVPLESKHESRCVFDYPGGYFVDFKREEFALGGFNAELGYYFVKSNNFLLYAAAGPYNLSKNFDLNNWGGRVRLRPQFRDYLALELSVSYDHIFHTIFQGEIIVSVPFYQFYSKRNRIGPACIPDRQIYQPVQRFEIIPLKARGKTKKNF
jgi:hypothetical protein